MTKKIFILLIMAAIFSYNLIYAQDTTSFVDKTKANFEIKTLKEDNAKLTASNTQLQSDNDKLNTQITAWRASINDSIDPLQKSVTQKVTDIRSLLANIVDEGMRSQATEALNRGVDLLRKLEVKKQLLETSIFQANSAITENKNAINRNNQKIEKNTETITFLDGSVKNTEEQNSQLQEYINSVTDFISNSETLLKDLQLPANQ